MSREITCYEKAMAGGFGRITKLVDSDIEISLTFIRCEFDAVFQTLLYSVGFMNPDAPDITDSRLASALSKMDAAYADLVGWTEDDSLRCRECEALFALSEVDFDLLRQSLNFVGDGLNARADDPSLDQIRSKFDDIYTIFSDSFKGDYYVQEPPK